MKAIYPLIVLACALLWSFPAAARVIQISGPVTINLSGADQGISYHLITAKTNIVGSVTNVSLSLKSTTTNFTMNTSSFLDLIANSFNTNFPAGTQLLLRGYSGSYFLAVSDSTGTNVSSLPLYTVLSSDTEGLVNAGLLTESTTNQIYFTGNDTEAFTTAVTFVYDDSTKTTADGTHSSFTLNCLVQSKQSRNLETGASTANVTMDLTGGGNIRGRVPAIITGTIHAKLTGFVPIY